ncbi:hypothetical protein [Arcobacter sp. FWKO B]|uniref:hypothetical protein n=1 Tax=Arcobacter sp. FWKO B TaxID=2593672 RepID=UPI0018A699F5|nr:hypothetical protein [Arcobacter sp. FWKO B]QOG11632.1 hypothetical protein FWKOB_02475 [Arcobacter sp. FWKO B]
MKIYLIVFFVFFVVGCSSTTTNQNDLISVLDINKKLQELDARITKTEQKVDEFSVLATSWAKRESMDFPVKETIDFDSSYASAEVVSTNKVEPLEVVKDIDNYLFITNIDKKTYDFDRVPFEIKRNSIVFNKKGEEVLLLRKGTVIESSYRVNKYFQIDSYNYNGNYYIPNTELFISEESFLE